MKRNGKKFKVVQNHVNQRTQVYRLIKEKKYHEAKDILLNLLQSDADWGQMAITLARCYANLEDWPKAFDLYREIYSQPSKSIEKIHKGEAALLLNNYREAFVLLQQSVEIDHNIEAKFWLACIYFVLGHIARCRELLEDITRIKDIWEEDDIKEALLQKLFSKFELQDFGTIYLDAWEYETEENENPLNRWVFLSNPGSNILRSNNQTQAYRYAHNFAGYLNNDDFFSLINDRGVQELEKIIIDFKNDENGYEFGNLLMERLNQKDFSGIAQIILGLQIEHLKEFSKYFGLSGIEVEQSEFNMLLSKLPYRIAIEMHFLLQIAVGLQTPSNPGIGINDENLSAALIRICFAAFYEDVNYYMNLQKHAGVAIEY